MLREQEYKRLQKGLVFICLLLLSGTLFAANVRWQWNDVNATYYRWQLNGTSEEEWTIVDGTVLYTDTYGLDPNIINKFYIQSSNDGINWSKSVEEIWGSEGTEFSETVEDSVNMKKSYFGVRVNLSPYSLAIYDFYNGHDIKDAKFLTMTNYSAALDTELFWKSPWPFALHLDAGYTFALKSETVIPNAKDVHYVRLGGGLDCVLANKKLSFAFGVLGGELITFNANRWNPGSYLGGRLLLEFNLSDNLLLGCQSRVMVSHQKTSDPLMSSLTWMVDPVALSITYRF